MSPAAPAVASIDTLTGLRSFASLWVVLLHLQHGVGISPHLDFGEVIEHGFWAVDVFFVLSGFLLSLLYLPRFEKEGFRRQFPAYLMARFARIYPLHLFCLLALALYFFSTTGFGYGEPLPGGFTRSSFVANLGLVHALGFTERLTWNYPSWSISAEWFAYLLVLPLLYFAARRIHLVMLCLGTVLGWLLLCQAVHDRGELVGAQSVNWAAPRIAVDFTAGYLVYRIQRHWIPGGVLSDLLVLAACSGLVWLCFGGLGRELLLLPICVGLILGLLRPGTLGRVLFANRPAVYWGERSYSTYMIHAVVQIYFNLALIHFGRQQLAPDAAWFVFGLQLLLVLALSALAYRWLEIPARNRLRGGFLTRRAEVA